MPKRGINRTFLLLSITLLLVWACLTTFLRANLDSAVRLFNDDADRTVYFERGAWLPTNKIPYRDVASEYPQVPTFIFGVLYTPFLNENDLSVVYARYSMLFSFLMICLLIGLAITLDKMLPKKEQRLIFLLLLPAPLYFAYNRFDVLPALIVALALFMVKNEKWEYAGILLGIGTLTKWYPGLLVLPVMMYMVGKKIPALKIAVFLILFGLTCLVILTPTYLMGGTKAILAPYLFHNNRGFEPASFPTVIEPLIKLLLPLRTENLLKAVFLLLQFGAVPLVALAHLDSFEKLLSWCLLIVTLYILFSRVYSPQWLLWIFPLMILLARNRFDKALIIYYGVITYFEFPIIYDIFGAQSVQMVLMGWINAALLALIVVQGVRGLALPDRPLAPA
jgi:hypothetical protein